MLRDLIEKIFGSYGVFGWTLKRHQYKQVWNAISHTEGQAKNAVAGTLDEGHLAEAADVTLQMLQESVGIRPDDVILEIGAGVGRVGAVLAPLCREWIGTDVSENMVRHMRKRLAGFPNVRVLSVSGYDLAAIESNSVDLVYCTVVLMHLSQWDRFKYIKEAYRVLKPGGRVWLDSVNIETQYGWEFFESHLAFAPNERPPNISELSTPGELTTYLRRAGFQAIRHHNHAMWVVAYASK